MSVYMKIAPHCRLSIECLEIKKKCCQRNSKLRGQASNKLGLKSKSRHWLALFWPIGVVFGLSTFFSTLPRLAAVNELSTLLSNVIFQLKFHWIISFLRFGVEMNYRDQGRLTLFAPPHQTPLCRIASLFDIRSFPLARVPPNVSQLTGYTKDSCE